MEYKSEQEKIIEEDPDGGWVDTHHYTEGTALEEKVADMTLEDKVSKIRISYLFGVFHLMNVRN